MKKPLIVGNWKLNGEMEQVKKILYLTRNTLIGKFCDIVVAPTFVYLKTAYDIIKNSQIFLSAQDVSINELGPFTGEVSANMLKDVGVNYCIIGHSERRNLHGEDNITVAKKFFRLTQQKITPILCVGDTIEDMKSGKAEQVCLSQIDYLIKKYGIEILKNTVLAYEPVWAIGSGQAADPAYVSRVLCAIKKFICQQSTNVFENMRLLYGGSVNQYNCKNYLQEVDGLLVGGASLKPKDFFQIVEKFGVNKD